MAICGVIKGIENTVSFNEVIQLVFGHGGNPHVGACVCGKAHGHDDGLHVCSYKTCESWRDEPLAWKAAREAGEKKRVEDLEKALTSTDRTKLHARISELTDKLSSCEVDNKLLTEELEATRIDLRIPSDALNARMMETVANDWKDLGERLQDECDQLNERIRIIEEEKTKLQGKVDDLESTVEWRNKVADQQRAKVDELEDLLERFVILSDNLQALKNFKPDEEELELFSPMFFRNFYALVEEARPPVDEEDYSD